MQERDVHPYFKPDKYLQLLQHHLDNGSISERDLELMKEYISDKVLQSGGTLTNVRKVKIINHLTNFARHFLSPGEGIDYSGLTDSTWRVAAGMLFAEGKNPKGEPYSKNTKHDYVVILKPFLKWMIKRGYSNPGLTEDGINEVHNPPKEYVTKSAADLLTDEEIYKLIEHNDTSVQMGALIAMLYWTGARVGEVLSLRWKDLSFENQLLRTDIKQRKTVERYSPCSEALEYVSAWRAKYPKEIKGGPFGDNFVFVSWDKNSKSFVQMQYGNTRKIIQNLCDNILHRHIKLHVFRASDITNMSKRGIPDSINKQVHWGNQGTQMLRTYTLLDKPDIDAAMLRRAGIETEKDELPTPRLCPACGTMNNPYAETCRLCGMALTHEKKQRQIEVRESSVAAQKAVSVMESIAIMAERLGMDKEVLLEKLLKQ